MVSKAHNKNLKVYGKKYPTPRLCPECTSPSTRQKFDADAKAWTIVCGTCGHTWSRSKVGADA